MILLVKLGIVVAAVIVAVFLTAKTAKGGEKIEIRARGLLVGVPLVLLALIVVLSVGQVEAGSRGVVLRFGRVTTTTLSEGLYFIVPAMDSVVLMDVRTRAYESPAGAASRDLQDVTTEVTLNYSLNPAAVNIMYRDFRMDYVNVIIKPAILESVKAVTALYDAEELITKRSQVRTDIQRTLVERVGQFGDLILVRAISITDFRFSETFTQSIEAKVIAVQKALEAENKLMEIEIEARQVDTRAKGEANAAAANAEGKKRAAILEAEGQSAAIKMVADAQAAANKVIDATLTDQLIQYTLVKELGDDIKVMILPPGQNFILGPEVLGLATK